MQYALDRNGVICICTVWFVKLKSQIHHQTMETSRSKTSKKVKSKPKIHKQVKGEKEDPPQQPEKLDYQPMEVEPKKLSKFEPKHLEPKKEKPVDMEINPILRYSHQKLSTSVRSTPAKPVHITSFPPALTAKPLRKPITEDHPNPEQRYIEQTRQVLIILRKALSSDEKQFSQGKQAPNKLMALEEVKNQLTNLYIRKFFIQEGGLKVFAQYLSPIYDENNDPQEVSIATKLRVVRMLKEFRLDSSQARANPELFKQVSRNARSRVIQLSSTCKYLIDSWDDSAMRPESKQKKKTESKKKQK